MREVLDRLREAETALDKELLELFYRRDSAMRTEGIRLLWRAKQALWLATLFTLNAAQCSEPETDD